MDWQELIAILVVLAAAAFLLRSMVRRKCGSGCGKCAEEPVAGRKSLPMGE